MHLFINVILDMRQHHYVHPVRLNGGLWFLLTESVRDCLRLCEDSLKWCQVDKLTEMVLSDWLRDDHLCDIRHGNPRTAKNTPDQ